MGREPFGALPSPSSASQPARTAADRARAQGRYRTEEASRRIADLLRRSGPGNAPRQDGGAAPVAQGRPHSHATGRVLAEIGHHGPMSARAPSVTRRRAPLWQKLLLSLAAVVLDVLLLEAACR